MSSIQQLIQDIDQATSALSLVKAVRALASAHSSEAIPTLIAVLGYNNPGAAVAAVDGLVKLGDEAVPSLLNNIDGYDYGARAWANRALAEIGHPLALENLLEAARGDFALSVRRAAAKGLGRIHWDKLPPTEMREAQTKALETLLKVVKDDEWVVRYSAIVGLEGLAQQQADFKPKIQEVLQLMLETEPELGVSARIDKAIETLSAQ